MKKTMLIFLVLLSAGLEATPVAITPPSTPTAPASAKLRWQNGETIPGEIAAASADDLTWKTSLFEDLLRLRWNAVDRIDWLPGSVPPPASFGVALRDGSFLYGDLVSITADTVSIHSARHGDVLLKRSEILSLRRMGQGGPLYSGPAGDQGWTAVTSQPDGNVMDAPPSPDGVSPLTTGPDGSLLIRSWNRGASLNVVLPDRFDIEFSVRSSKRPQFLLALGGNVRAALRVETWDDELVLTDGDQFQVIRKIGDDERALALRILCDRKAQKCWVFTPAGDLITSWPFPVTSVPEAPTPAAIFRLHRVARGVFRPNTRRRGGFASAAPGLVLQNRGLDLSLDLILVRAWDGKLPAAFNAKQPRLELTDGRSAAGHISSATPGFVQVQAATQTAPTQFPIADVTALIFSSDPPLISDRDTTLSYQDGATIHGGISSISSGHAVMTTTFTTAPLSSQLDQPLQLLVRPGAPKTATTASDLGRMDKLVAGPTTFHGTLSLAGDGSLRWMPIGGTEAVVPSKSLASEITRALPPNMVAAPIPALFYLDTGDVIPGDLRSIDQAGAEFQSSIMDAHQLPADELDGIEFVPPAPLNVKGFDDPRWKIVKGTDKTVRQSNGGLQMDAGTAILYPSLMQSSEIRFKFSSNGLTCARLRMFCTEGNSTHSINLLLASTGNQFLAGTETTPGQFDSQAQILTKPGEPVSVCLKITENQVELLANDVSLQQIPIDTTKVGGAGLLIEPAGMWGNGVGQVSLSDFSAQSVPGRTWLPEVTAEIKTQVLTVPRFERNDPPRQVLLAANGDVLRGEIEGATDSHFAFRSGLESLNVPRDRVRAVIWLKPPDPNAPIAAPVPPTPDVLETRLQMRIGFGGARLNQYLSFLKSQVPALKYKLPDHDDQRTVQMQFGNQTVGEALNDICSRFGLSYRVDTDGTVIIESQTQPQLLDVAFKSYWLKPSAFPEKPSAQEVLAGKGITFAPDASAQWQAKSGLLQMTNTPENQARLAALINTDFGGSLGSPTYWLQLTSGGRLSLAVDKVSNNFIIGHNPAYGAIKVPMAQVYIIRNSPPEPTTATKSLEGWRLVNAPEPAIPDGGGESSPLLGKQASSFKLPLLTGGDFDLGQQKGRVVVLDFWASWCGPCIKSLPGLIDTLASFPTDRVKLIGVNQGEAPSQVKDFLKTRGLKLTVALDADENIGRTYGVDAIPQTIIVGPDGKVAWTQTGYDPDGDTSASAVIKHLLETPVLHPADKPLAQ